jgi:hypothetical protein
MCFNTSFCFRLHSTNLSYDFYYFKSSIQKPSQDWELNILWRVRPRAVVAMQHSCCYYVTMVEQFHGYAHHSCTVVYMVTTIVGCIATNSGKASVSIGTAPCYKGKAIHNNQSVSLWDRSELVYASAWVSHQLVAGVRRDQSSKKAFAVRSQQLVKWDHSACI